MTLWDPEVDDRPTTITVGSTAYMINGEHYDRISAVLGIVAKPGLDKWRRQHGFVKSDQLLKDAAWLGTRVHAMIEDYCRRDDPSEGFCIGNQWIQVRGSELEPYYHGYAKWHEDNVRQTIMLETTVWSPEFGFAGTFDHFAELKDGRLALLDNKTSRYLSWTYRLQTAAYWGAVLEQKLLPEIDVRGIVHLSSKTPGSCRLVEYPPVTDARDWSVWLGVLDTYRMAQEYEDDWKH